MPSRISGACTPCRSKKQKCSGHHPTCSQCANASIDCTWPEQRKRGPAKGYIEGLESRLHNAESLLLALLPLVSDHVVDQASHTLRRTDEDYTDSFGSRRSSPPLLNKKTGLDYWDAFPIDSRRNIRKWQYDCEANTQSTAQYSVREGSSSGRRYRSPTHSPASVGVASPRGSAAGMSHHPQPQVPHNNTWVQSIPPGVSQNQMQAGAAQQLLSLSHQHRDQWMNMPQQNQGAGMQLDPNLTQPRTMPQLSPSQLYTGNVQQTLFW